MDVHELRRKSEQEASEVKRIFNPLLKDFSKYYDDGSGRKLYTVKANEIGTFSTPTARHLKKHLIDFVMNEREISPTNREAILEIEKEVEVKI